mmetsp:Transcript_30959/g.61708  ORF Transcript_30959/g.61708 Transcript_30959/m.61708 type:complete len:1422 (-) Transcript_30959:375-4640(-)
MNHSEVDKSTLDLQLGKNCYHEKICLIRLNHVVTAFAPSLCQLWPALKFDSFYELNKRLKEDVELDAKMLKRLQAAMTIQYRHLSLKRGNVQGPGQGAVPAVAYLLGNRTLLQSLVLIPNGKGHRAVLDFHSYVDEIHEMQHAFDLTLKRMEDVVATPGFAESLNLTIPAATSAIAARSPVENAALTEVATATNSSSTANPKTFSQSMVLDEETASPPSTLATHQTEKRNLPDRGQSEDQKDANSSRAIARNASQPSNENTGVKSRNQDPQNEDQDKRQRITSTMEVTNSSEASNGNTNKTKGTEVRSRNTQAKAKMKQNKPLGIKAKSKKKSGKRCSDDAGGFSCNRGKRRTKVGKNEKKNRSKSLETATTSMSKCNNSDETQSEDPELQDFLRIREFKKFFFLRDYGGEEVISSTEAWRLLKTFYNFKTFESDETSYFCLPDFDTLRESTFHQDYFADLQDMRKNLCAYGIPSSNDTKITEKDRHRLEIWVRCAIIDHPEQTPMKLPEMQFDWNDASYLLARLGCTTSNMGGGLVHFLPGVEENEAKLETNCFVTRFSLCNHVARFGWQLPREILEKCHLCAQLKLELDVFVICVGNFDVWKRRKPDRAHPQQGSTFGAEPNEKCSLGLPNPEVSTEDEGSEVAGSFSCSWENSVESKPHKMPPFGISSSQKFCRSNSVADGRTPTYQWAAEKLTRASDNLASVNRSKGGKEEARHISLSSAETSQTCYSNDDDSLSSPGEISSDPDDFDQDSIEPKPKHSPHLSIELNHHFSRERTSSGKGSVEFQSMDENDSHPSCEKRGISCIMTKASESNDSKPKTLFLSPNAVPTNRIEQGSFEPKTEITPPVAIPKSLRKFVSEEKSCPKAESMVIVSASANHLDGKNEETLELRNPFAQSKATSTFVDTPTETQAHTEPLLLELNTHHTNCPIKRKLVRYPSSSGMAHEKKGLPPKITLEDPPPKKSKTLFVASVGNGEQQICPKTESSNGGSKITINGKLQDTLERLKSSNFNLKMLAKARDSHLLKMEREIIDAMKWPILNDRTETAKSSRLMYIFGPPGSGKTLTVQLCAEVVTKWANINFHQEPVFCHISMATRHSILDHKSHLVRSIRRTIALALEIDENSRLFAIEKELEKQALVLVIDEVDVLFEEYGGIGETLFNNLVNMAEADHPRFTLIAISKSKNDDQCCSPLRDHHHAHKLVFPAYSEADLISIVQERVGKKVIDLEALQMISRKVASEGGNANEVLKITSEAVTNCHGSFTMEELVHELDDDHKPLVHVSHVIQALQENTPTTLNAVICTLPPAAKVILCAVIALCEEKGGTVEVSLITLKRLCMDATNQMFMADVGTNVVKTLLELLDDTGLLVLKRKHGWFDASRKEWKLAIKSDEVKHVVKKTFLKEPFFCNLDYYVRSDFKECCE